MTTATERTVTLVIPIALAPMSLSKNGRVHWRTRNRDFQTLKQWAAYEIHQTVFAGRLDAPDEPWTAAIMHVEWQYNRGRAPDDDNVIARVSAVRDAFQEAGVVANDQHIRIGTVTFTKVKQSDDPCAVVTLERA